MKLLNRGEPLFEGNEFHFEMWMDYLNSNMSADNISLP